MNIFGVIITKSKNLLPDTFANRALMGPFIILSAVDSTNNYAMAKLHAGTIQSGSCFHAIEQSAGKGQRGKCWMGKKGENITMSVCVQPVHREFPFLLPAAMALGCYDFIKEFNVENVFVKWPNDVYISDKKAAGILIENIFLGVHWEWAVVGTGVNVNQDDFGTLSGKAISLKEATGSTFDVIFESRRLHKMLLARLDWMTGRSSGEIMEAYNSVLYKKDQEVRLKMGAAVFSTVISHVDINGGLVTKDTMERNFAVGDVIFV
jgi:BirA family biotin operon repressor/biotin-[acetyl-CoA-carboxylase] ligase